MPLVYQLFRQEHRWVATHGRDNRWKHLSGKLPLKQGIPIKVVVDNHIDRSGVKALRGVELTDTNYLIDLFNYRFLKSIRYAYFKSYQLISFFWNTKDLVSVWMVRWLLRKGPTRSHSELGRETFLRQWYFSSSCGRVGHCRTFYTLAVTLLGISTSFSSTYSHHTHTHYPPFYTNPPIPLFSSGGLLF